MSGAHELARELGPVERMRTDPAQRVRAPAIF